MNPPEPLGVIKNRRITWIIAGASDDEWREARQCVRGRHDYLSCRGGAGPSPMACSRLSGNDLCCWRISGLAPPAGADDDSSQAEPDQSQHTWLRRTNRNGADRQARACVHKHIDLV
jgi:hypothetical protein